MSEHLSPASPSEAPRVCVASLSENDALRNHILKPLGPLKEYNFPCEFFSDRYWMFEDDPEGKAAGAVGQLLGGIAARFLYFASIHAYHFSTPSRESESSSNAHATIGYLALLARNTEDFTEPEVTTDGLVRMTNLNLAALRSPYQLPLRPPLKAKNRKKS